MPAAFHANDMLAVVGTVKVEGETLWCWSVLIQGDEDVVAAGQDQLPGTEGRRRHPLSRQTMSRERYLPVVRRTVFPPQKKLRHRSYFTV